MGTGGRSMVGSRTALRFGRAFASGLRLPKLLGDSFGSVHRGDAGLERLVRPRNVERDSPERVRSTKELRVPLSLSKSKRDSLEALQAREPAPPGHLCFIECSRPEFNLLEANHSDRGALCSQYWVKNKHHDEWFVIRRRHKEHSSQFVKWQNAWDHYVPDRLDPLVREALRELRLKSPTEIQSQCLQVFPSRFHLFIGAETGSGKTIAYGAPLITRILHQKRRNVSERAIVVTVTAALREQTALVLSKLSKGGLIVSVCNPEECSSNEWDILVGTPDLVERHIRQHGDCTHVKHLIMDEADMILDESFTEVLTEIFAVVPIANSVTNSASPSSGARVVFCSATCPEELECLVDGVVDRAFLRYLKSSNLHFLLPNAELKFMRIKEQCKIERLKRLLLEDMKRGDLNQTMVFCKDRATASFVHQELQSFEYKTKLWSSHNGACEDGARIIVATDGAARGIDLPRLSHVINYDLPRHTNDFLHRIGRVGRLSSAFPGRVTSFVRTPTEVRLTNAIESAARRGHPLSKAIAGTYNEPLQQ